METRTEHAKKQILKVKQEVKHTHTHTHTRQKEHKNRDDKKPGELRKLQKKKSKTKPRS